LKCDVAAGLNDCVISRVQYYNYRYLFIGCEDKETCNLLKLIQYAEDILLLKFENYKKKYNGTFNVRLMSNKLRMMRILMVMALVEGFFFLMCFKFLNFWL